MSVPVDHKSHNLTIQALKKRTPGLKALAQRYNAVVENMADLKRKKEQFKDVLLPRPIDLDHLFDMEGDDDLMQDVGLDSGDHGEPPDWLADDSVRFGIKAMQQYDRAVEEKGRLAEEVKKMVQWLQDRMGETSKCAETCSGAKFLCDCCTLYVSHQVPRGYYCRSCLGFPTGTPSHRFDSIGTKMAWSS